MNDHYKIIKVYFLPIPDFRLDPNYKTIQSTGDINVRKVEMLASPGLHTQCIFKKSHSSRLGRSLQIFYIFSWSLIKYLMCCYCERNYDVGFKTFKTTLLYFISILVVKNIYMYKHILEKKLQKFILYWKLNSSFLMCHYFAMFQVFKKTHYR